ncbi:hypothetical protein SanaruYs_05500 [Chryseotalea sanaruensis]|uniref:GIY-YIG domain-containing protein n=1 Tax=Chryseotalea sanaruensis TaxID=2482724 RepID=A0A401U624_9BACT|nr:hypothetical protein [Chryseotalea sanaruensis]GCC50335.1 hypothetical protein SanaruYs_05500 [Chryseotalea sanaruensis]
MISEFNKSVVERLKHYVYCLIDPRTYEVFYIGKGYGNRIFQHMNAALNSNLRSDKLEQIRSIKQSGAVPDYYVLRYGLEHDEAIQIESIIIDFSSLFQNSSLNLKNLVKGHNSFLGIMKVSQIVQMYDAKVIEITEPCLIIIVNRLYSVGMTETELYEVVREKWRLNRRKITKVKYVIAAFVGLVREVYQVNKWYDTFDERTQKTRVGFEGIVASPDIRSKYVNGALDKYRSNGTPFLYVNC